MPATVTLQPHDPAWLAVAHTEFQQLREVLGKHITDAEHFGSTAAPGLVAKPTIDLILSTSEWPWPAELDQQLARLGFHFYKAPNPRWCVYLKQRDGRQRGFHLHLVETGSQHWQDHLLFRDHLRSNQADADAYAGLKQELVKNAEHLGIYQAGKAELVRQIMERARTP